MKQPINSIWKQTPDWKTFLEYALPDKLTEEEKQVIRNNVGEILATRETAAYKKGAIQMENAIQLNKAEILAEEKKILKGERNRIIATIRAEVVKKTVKVFINNYPEIMEKWRKYRGEKTCGEFCLEEIKKLLSN